ncbi:hypothetical protein FRC11_001557 [Ceratobasidium sp. 423]|nr:hypothetical protein FRC11_001557 [Ceratobasidium sp. 423]
MEATLELGDLMVTCGNGVVDEGEGEDQARPALPCDAQSNAELPANTVQCWLPAPPEDKFCIHFGWNGQSRRGTKAGAGIFCIFYIDGVLVERAFCPLEKGDKTAVNGKVRKGAGPIVREWEICGKFYRGEDGKAYERRFYFIERVIDNNANRFAETGTLRVVLYWALPNLAVINPYPRPTEKLADEVSEALSRPSNVKRDCSAVSLGPPVISDVKENNMQVERLDNEDFTFLFHYAHPAWLLSGGESGAPVPTGVPALCN